ncbi:MAG: tetratricopeptide repeat protein [Candidatus Binataceae bacterium]
MRKPEPRRLGPIWIVGALALAGLGMAGCSDQSDITQLNQNEFTLRGMIANDHQEIDALSQQVRELKDQITELQHNAGGPGSDQLASISDRLSKVESQISGLQAGMSAAPGTATAPGTPAATGEAGAPTGPSASSGPSTIAPPAAEPTPTWPQELDDEIASAKDSDEPGAKAYRAGLDAMKAGKYPLAIAKLTEVVHHYPKSPLVEPAQYFTANALYESGKYDQAILQFNDAMMRDPKGKFASQSLLREAQAFMKLNDNIDARLTLQKLLADHSDSPEAAPASQMMKSLTAS